MNHAPGRSGRDRKARPRLRRGVLGMLALVLTLPASLSSQAPTPALEYDADIVRLLNQATFGATPALIEHAQAIGIAAFIEEQLAVPARPYPDLPLVTATRPAACTGDCRRDNYTMYPLQVHFFDNALTGHDQLRQRVAFALQQIFVVSAVSSRLTQPSWMGPYQQMLYAGALGNFRDLLRNVSISPAMGNYLNALNNRAFDPATGVKPNENYARELLQLFSIGLVLLNEDGTVQAGPDGAPMPSYDQATVEEFARVFTGWVLAPQVAPGIPNYREPMRPRAANHDRGTKRLLNGAVIPAGLSAPADLDAAVDNIFQHQNVGPFIGRQLIQKLVTSNPSPAYVARVARVFNDNGAGTRGDLASVVRAILLDDEARGGSHADPAYGHLLEPVLFVTRLLRAFNATSDGVLASVTAGMGQDVFRAPSVFSFYPPGYRIVGGGGLSGPEFRLFDSASAFARINFVNTVVFTGIAPALPDRPRGTTLELTPYLPLASDPALLVRALDTVLMHGSMPPGMEDVVVEAVQAVPRANALLRVRTAVYLMASSNHFQVQR